MTNLVASYIWPFQSIKEKKVVISSKKRFDITSQSAEKMKAKIRELNVIFIFCCVAFALSCFAKNFLIEHIF